MANGGQLNYQINLQINKQNLDALNKSLDEVMAKTQQFTKAMPDYAEPYKEASEAAKELKAILDSSWNTKLGQLDLTKVEKSIINSYGSLKEFKLAMEQIGPEGQKVFAQFSQAILGTQAPIKQTSAMLDRMATTFKNTIRYGISSSIFNRLTSSISEAYTYVKKLDSSLNDIRIVSGQSADQMERFAIQANKAAQSLGASTLNYTNAALIYYQQGLSEQEVAERTDITVKMANVLGSTSKEVSEYMTAIWNNFDNGSKSLEHYADVITALGATTAASSEEIAEGLEKFSAIGKTVGLSYEYATSALATVVAQTRQSADTVGNAFKTLFARIQDLELGKTLDDGTTLGKYSEALEKVGVGIKDQNGELKKMDVILDEMGSKWQSLNDDQKVALAQNVAGIRQYTQLIALMDNWSNFQNNLNTANNATGDLASRQDIYMDSLEAHIQRLDAAWEGLYNNLFDEDFIKTITDGLTKIVNLANTFVTGLGGGLNSVIYLAMSVGNVFSNQISSGLLKAKQNAEAAKEQIKNVAVQERLVLAMHNTGTTSELRKRGVQEYIEEQKINEEIVRLKGRMTQADQQDLSILDQKTQELREQNEILNLMINYTPDIGKKKKKIDNNTKLSEKEKQDKIDELNDKEQEKFNKKSPKEQRDWIIKDLKNRQSVTQQKMSANNQLIDKITNKEQLGDAEYKQLNAITKSLKQKLTSVKYLKEQLGNSKDDEAIAKAIDEEIKARKRQIKILEKVVEKKKQVTDADLSDPNEVVTAIQKQQEYLQYNNDLYQKEVDFLNKKTNYNKQNLQDKKKENDEEIKKNNELKKGLILTQDQKDAMENITSGLFTIGTSLSSIIGAVKTISNPDLSGWEKFSAITSVLGTQTLVLLSNYEKIQKLLPSLLVMLGTEKTLESAIAKTKEIGVLATLKEIGLNVIRIVQDTIIALLEGQITGATIALVVAVAAITVALGAWIAHLIKINSEEYKLQKRVEETAEAVKEAQEAYKELKDTISSYTDARKGIDSLKEGTVEFYEAIIKSNEEAQKLIETLNLMPKDAKGNGQYSIDKNGLITIDESVLQRELFKKQQEIYRAQGQNFQARKDVEVYNQKEIIKQFTEEVNLAARQKGSGATISYDQAKDILSNQGKFNNTLIENNKMWSNFEPQANNIYKVLERNNQQLSGFQTLTAHKVEEVKTSVDNSSIVIQKAIDNNLGKYNRSQANIDNFERQRIISTLRGYGTQNQVKDFDSYTERSQIAIAEMVRQENDEYKHDENVKDLGVGDYLKNFATNSLKYIWTGPISPFISSFKTGWDAGENDSMKDYIKELYAQYALGYTKEDNGQWFNEYNNAVSKDEMKDILKSIDTDIAVQAYNNGDFATAQSLQHAQDTANYVRKNVEDWGFGTSSSQYMTEAMLGLKTGTFDQELTKLLTNEEKEQIKSAVKPEVTEPVKSFSISVNDPFSMYTQYSQEEIDKFLEASDEAGRSIERLKADLEEYNNELIKEAEVLGTSKEALEFFGKAMYNASKETNQLDKSSAEAIADQYKFNKTYNNAIKVFKDNKDAIKAYGKALKNNKEISYDVADAMGELSQSLKEMGLSLSAETISEHLDDIEKLLTGTKAQAEQAYKELAKLAQLDTLKNIFGPEAQDQIEKYGYSYQQLVDAINNTEPGTNLSSKYATALQQMIHDTDLTVSQINELAKGLNIEIPVEYNVPPELTVKDEEITTKATSTLHRYTGQMPNPAFDGKNDKRKTIPVDYAWVETTEDKTDHFLVPKDTNFKVNSNSHSLGGKRNFTQSASNKGSGGGGGDSKPDKMDPFKKEVDRYHKVNAQIEKIDNKLKKVQSQQDKLLGSNLINNLTQQWELLNNQIDNYNEKLKIAYGEQNELAKTLSKSGVLFNDDGTIQNYNEILTSQENYINSLINKYNSMSKTQQESFRETIEKAEENYEELKKNLDRYDELVTDFIPAEIQKIQDAFDQQIEINITVFNKEIEITLDMNQATRDWNAWKKRVIDEIKEEDILGNSKARLADAFTYFNDQNTGDIQVAAKHLQEVLEEYNNIDTSDESVFGDDRAKALENLKTYLAQLETSMTDFLDLQDELYQNILDEMDLVQEKFDKQVESYELLSEIVDHDIKVMQLLYGEDAYGELSKFYEAQQDNYLQQLDFQRQQKDFWYEQMSMAEKDSKEWESAREKWISATQSFNELLETTLENARAKFENTLNDIFKNLNLQITNGLGLDYVSEQWDLINKKSEQYLDNINAAAGVAALERKYLKAIDNTSRVQDQRRINALMEDELNGLKTKDRLTQYDLDRAEKKYNLMVAQMALEDAQQKKNQMRLRRDSQGNYTYQYVTDEDAIRDAQEAVSNIYTELYNFDRDRYKENLDSIYSLWDEYQQKLAEAALINDPQLRADKELLIQTEYGNLINEIIAENEEIRNNLQESTFLALSDLYEDDLAKFTDLTVSERDLLLDQIGGGLTQLLEVYGINAEEFRNMTVDEQNAIIENLGDAFHKLSGFYNEDVAAFRHLTEEEQSILVGYMVPQWHSAIQQMAFEFYGPDGFEKNTVEGWHKIKNAENEYQKDVEKLDEVSGLALTHIKEGMDKDIEITETLIEVNNDLILKYQEELTAVHNVYEEFMKLYNAKKAEYDLDKQIAAEAEAKRKAEEEAARKAAEEAEKSKNSTQGPKVEQNPAPTPTPSSGGGSSSSGSSSGGGNGKPEVGDMVTYLGGGYTADSYGGGATGNRGPGKKAKITIVKEGRPRPYHLYSTDSAYGWVRKDQISGYDTGGYTGAWNNSGKLAFLHQKELVLNAQDTQNMLDAVTIMRQLAYSLGESTLARLASISAGTGYSSDSGVLEQIVHIDAQFPNVHDSREIEAALNNLVNAASQRAFIRK